MDFEISPRYYGNKSSKKEEKMFRCKECKKTFNRKHNLTKHERCHTGEKPYHCKHCDSKFRDSSNLTKHIKRLHSSGNKGSNSASSSGSYSGKGDYRCELCERCFVTGELLHQHTQRYVGKKVFECRTCGKRFHLRTSLTRHEDTHNERRRYSCDACDKTFSQKMLLERHRQYHIPIDHDVHVTIDEDNYDNEYNDDDDGDDNDDDQDDESQNGGNLEYIQTDSPVKYENYDSSYSHRIGKGIQVHVCNICGKVFTYRSLWTRHLKSHNSEKQFKCQTCEKVFPRQYYLTQHMKTCY